MKRIVNFRAFFWLFLVCLCCAFCFAKAFIDKIYLLVIVLPCLLFVYLFLKKKFVILTISVLSVCFVSLYSYFYVANFNKMHYQSENLFISARIGNINIINDNFSYLLLENVVILDGENSKGLEGNISVGLTNYDDTIIFEEGDNIVCNCALTSVDFFDEKGETNSLYLKYNIKFVSNTLSASQVVFTQGERSLLEKFKSYNQSLLTEEFGEERGNLAYALLYGDKSTVDDSVLMTFKSSGVVHLFSVSGLHVGLIVALLYFVLDKLKIKRWINLIVSACFLLLFCFICSFTPSVVRASIMALVVLLASILFRKNDPLNTLSLSGVILLLINPLNVFDGGFQMTFTAVFGILTFGSLFQKIKINNKVIKKLIVFVGVTFSTQLALLPLLAKFYGTVSAYSLFSNLFSIPLFSVFYPILFVTNMIVLILPFLKFLFVVSKAMLETIYLINHLIVKLPFGMISIHNWGGFATLLHYVFMFCVSKYLMIGARRKSLICFLLITVIIASYSFYNKSYYYHQNLVVFTDDNLGTFVATENNDYYLIDTKITKVNISSLRSKLESQKIYHINGFFITEKQTFEAGVVSEFLFDYKTTIYLYEDCDCILNLTQMGNSVVIVNDRVDINKKFKIKYLYDLGSPLGAIFTIGNKDVCFFDYTQFNLDSNFEKYLDDYLNFKFDCVKINCSENKKEYAKSFFNASQFVFDDQKSQLTFK